MTDETALREAAQALVDALPYEPGSMLGGKVALVVAALASEPETRATPEAMADAAWEALPRWRFSPDRDGFPMVRDDALGGWVRTDDLRAAIRAAEPPALDVERLETALGNLYEQKWPQVGKAPRVPTTVFNAYAEDIIAEYVRLQPDPETT